MTDPWGNLDRVGEILERAAGLSGPARAAYLREACAGDDALRAEVDSMLSARAEQGDFLAEPACAPAPGRDGATVVATPHERVGQVIGRYKLLEQIGDGGFGTVWAAEQREPFKRRVALKVIKLGMDTRQVIARFEAERQALAMMDHPNIAKVLDAGATETGRPYFVMELVKGVPMLEYCDTERLDTPSRLVLFVKVCHAIQHAHQKGIIHRDIKPSNVLLTLHDGVPVPKVIDFGIAKATNAELTEKTLYTLHRHMVGTPAYMSPEQVEMSGLDIDTRSDVYALGVLLYELLTGTTPFDTALLMKAGYSEMMRIIREDEPHKPSTRLSALGDTGRRTAEVRGVDLKRLGFLLRGDLDWIVMKCLEKDRARRYETANALAADIRRHLDDEPVVAGPPSARYRVGKFVRRNRAIVSAAVVVAFILVAGIAGTTWGMRRAQHAEAGTQRELTRAMEIKRLITEMLSSVHPALAQGADISLLRGILDRTAEFLATNEITDELVAAELHNIIGVVYRDLGLWDEAELHIQIALETRTRLLGEKAPATLQSAYDRVLLDRFQGRFAGVEPLLLRNLDLRTEVLGADHPDTLRTMEMVATGYGSMGRHAEAEKYFRENLERRTRALGREHPDTLESMAHLGRICAMQGRAAEAEPLMKEALHLRMQALGENHPDILTSLGNLVKLYEGQGRYAEAEPLWTEILDTARRVLGEQHPYTLLLMSGVGRFYTRLERHDDARGAFEAELVARRRVQGVNHPLTWRAMRSLAEACQKAGRVEEALTLCRELVGLLPADGPNPAALDALAWVLSAGHPDLRDSTRAVALAQRAVALAESRQSRRVYQFLDTLALALHMSGDTAGAIATQQRAIQLVPAGTEDGTLDDFEANLRIYMAALPADGPGEGP